MNELTYKKAELIIERAKENGFEACIKTVNGKPVVRILDNKITIGDKNGN